jgi:hypothetical protein
LPLPEASKYDGYLATVFLATLNHVLAAALQTTFSVAGRPRAGQTLAQLPPAAEAWTR